MTKTKQSNKQPRFVQTMLTLLKQTELSSIIKWSIDGKTIQILSKKRLEKEVLPKYFKYPSYSNFLRNLNLYKFQSYKNLDGILCYQNKLITRSCITFQKQQKTEKIEISNKLSKTFDFQEIQNSLFKLQNEQTYIKMQLKKFKSSYQELSDELEKIIQIKQNLRVQGENNINYFLEVMTFIYKEIIMSKSNLFDNKNNDLTFQFENNFKYHTLLNYQHQEKKKGKQEQYSPLTIFNLINKKYDQ